MTDDRTAAVRVETVTAAVLLVLAIAYMFAALEEGLGTLGESGAGFFPFIVALALVPVAAVVLLQEVRGTAVKGPADEDDEEFQADVHWRRIAAVLLVAGLVPTLGPMIGFVITLSVALALISKIMGLRGWRAPVLLGAVFGAATWLIFVYWLYVPLPPGHLGLA